MKIKTSELIGPALDWAVATIMFPKGAYGGEAEHYSGTNVGWEAKSPVRHEYYFSRAEGPTPLVAAMRCYAALKLGDETEIPEELS